MGQTPSKTIVFIHGLSENSVSWAEWKSYFAAKGYQCHAPDYPFHEGSPQSLRENPNKALGKIRLSDVLTHCQAFLDLLPDKAPILIGHSMGGLIVQQLIGRGSGSLGVCITPAPPKGITGLSWSFVKSNLPTINPLKGSSLFHGSKKWFHYSIANTLDRSQSDLAFEKVFVPESRNIPRSSTGEEGKVDFKKPHRPLLIVGAEKDHIVPVVLNRKNHKAYRDTGSICDFKEFEGRSHFICGQEGWEEVAAYIEQWMVENQGK